MPKTTDKIKLGVYVTSEERDIFAAAAKSQGLSVSAYVRMLIFADIRERRLEEEK